MGMILSGSIGLIIGFSSLIFVHELGHFLLAKWNGVRVYVFSVGMGPYLVSFTWHGTVYALSLIPIGGYVKMMGQDDLNPGQAESKEKSDYRNKRPGQRAAILAAGAGFNILFTLLLFTVCYYHGMWEEPARIGEIPPGKPLASATYADPPDKPAHLQPGDRIVMVDGVPVKTFLEAQLQIAGAAHDRDLFLTVQRASPGASENPILVVVRPGLDPKLGASSIGLQPYEERHSFALGFTTHDTVVVVVDPAKALEKLSPEAREEKIKELPAVTAGFELDDEIIFVNDPERPERPLRIKRPLDMIFAIQGSAGRTLKVHIRRDGVAQDLTVTPHKSEETGEFMIGLATDFKREVTVIDDNSPAHQAGLEKGDFIVNIMPDEEFHTARLAWTKVWGDPKAKVQEAKLSLPPPGTPGLAFNVDIFEREHLQFDFFGSVQMAWDDTKQFAGSVFTVLKGLFTHQVSLKALSGPVGISGLMYRVSSNANLVHDLWWLAFLSLNLGVLQFVPLPLLDGWHLLLLLIEKLKGSPVAPKVQEAFQYVGIFLIGGLLLYVTYNDILRSFGF